MLKKLSKKLVKTLKQSWAEKFQDLNTDAQDCFDVLTRFFDNFFYLLADILTSILGLSHVWASIIKESC